MWSTTIKIGIVGAPGCGKTTLAARLYAEILERGINSTRLVPEYAHEHLGLGGKIETLQDQIDISLKQVQRQKEAVACNFTPIICDSAIWIGGIYISHKQKNLNQFNPNDEYVQEYLHWVNDASYDMTIYVPLFNDVSQVNQFRLHDYEQSVLIDGLIKNHLTYIPDVQYAPKSLKDREYFVKYLAGKIIEEIYEQRKNIDRIDSDQLSFS